MPLSDADLRALVRTPRADARRPAMWELPLGALALAPLFVAVSTGAVSAQSAQLSCTQTSGGYSCTVPAGTYTSGVTQSAGALAVDDYGTFNLTASGSGPFAALLLTSQGSNGAVSSSDKAGGNGSGAGYLTAEAEAGGAITISATSALTGWGYGLLGQSKGGDGGNYTGGNEKYNGGTGGNAGNVFVSNSQVVSLQGTYTGGVSGVVAQGTGGSGGYGASGGNGGSGGQVQLENYGAVSIGSAASFVSASSDTSPGAAIAGIAALSQGGMGGNSLKNDESRGGSGGLASVYSNAAVSVYLTWLGAGPTPGSEHLYGVLASSSGGVSGGTAQEGTNGGAGGASGAATVRLTGNGDVTVVAQNTANAVGTTSSNLIVPSLTGAAVGAVSQGGQGGLTKGSYKSAGNGGQAGSTSTPTSVSSTGATISVSGNAMAGVEALNQGGAGGNGNWTTYENQSDYPEGGYGAVGGAGGAAESVAVDMSNWGSVTTAGTLAPGVFAGALGGAGGDGGNYYGDFAHDSGAGGAGGLAGEVNVTLANTAITTTGAYSFGVLAVSEGGEGGDGGSRYGASGDAGGGGNGGSASAVTVALASGAVVTTSGAYSPGVVAYSRGGDGGDGGEAYVGVTGSPHNGGKGGDSGLATVTLAQGASVTTQGANAPGLLAVSIAGSGGTGTYESNIISSNGGNGGSAGSQVNGVLTAAEIENAGAVVTKGDNAPGIEAQGVSGGGGTGGDAGGLSGDAGEGGTAGTIGVVIVTNAATGSVTTDGVASVGILAQSLAGAGGNGGDLNFANTGVGGDAGYAADAGLVQVTNLGTIATSGFNAIGILAQAIGGGGGTGGSADNLSSIGGTGGAGGDGGGVTVTAGGTISTAGDLASGIVAQSIGGGGGNGGSVTSYSVVVGYAIGGSAGNGGAGAATTVAASDLTLHTQGSQSAGIVAQSIGGGGGTGGAAFNVTSSALLGASLAVGGSGGNGGDGGAASVSLTRASIVTAASVQDATDPATAADGTVLDPLAVDSFGVVVQSIGGGGGVGGSSIAKAFVQDIQIPGTDSAVGVSGSWSQGGSGGGGGNGGTATLNLASDVSVLTYGNGSHALLAQSIGGGGGTGGDSSANATTFGFKILNSVTELTQYNLDVTVSLGGDGGTAGNGGAVNVTLGGTNGVADAASASSPVTITTLGDYADGVLAQSVGGGGGNAGTGAGSTQNATSGGTALTASITVGATGSAGGSGGAVTVTGFTGTTVQTYGDTAYGIFAQSVGGGGGSSTGGSYQFGLPSYNDVAALIGGSSEGSGLGGISSSLTLNLGNQGGAGGNGGKVTVALTGTTVATSGEAATAILAQSVGGGGGAGGSAGSSGSSDNPNVISELGAGKSFVDVLSNYLGDVTKAVEAAGGLTSALRSNLSDFMPTAGLSLSLGGTGGAGGDGGAVSVTLAQSTVTTLDDYAYAIMAQSVGGGGGVGGAAVAGGSSGLGSIMNISANIALGATGGSGGAGGAVTVSLADSLIATSGYAAYALFAQSVGGGGGVAGSAQTNSSGYFSLGASNSGGASAGGNGGTVTLSGGSGVTTISTTGDTAMGVLLQSIGGGGGVAGDGFTLTAGVLAYNGSVKLSAGGSGAAGNGGDIVFDATNTPYLAISTSGQNAYGILAQSVGGGGGLTFRQPGTTGTYTLGGSNSVMGNGGEVSVQLRDGSTISTTGDGSHAIFAQSVGGGGGIAGFAAGTTLLYDANASNVNKVTIGSGGVVTVTTGDSTIITTGDSAYGIFAQSVGAGGGVMSGGDGASVIAGTTGKSGSYGDGGAVVVVQDGIISATGVNSVGIFAQSAGQASDGIKIWVDGTVTGGSGTQGYGIWVDSTNYTNIVTIDATGTVSAVSGKAINATGGGITNVTNYGTVIGSYDLTSDNSTSGTYTDEGVTVLAAKAVTPTPTYGTFTNQASGVLVAGSSLVGNLVNKGTVVLGGADSTRTSALTGTFLQSESGVIIANADFEAGTIDRLTVSGDATLNGRVEVLATTLLPNRQLTFLEVDGTAIGTLEGSKSNVFDYVVNKSGDAYSILATANFSATGANLNPHQQRAAHYLQNLWDAGGGSLGALFGSISTLKTDLYADALTTLATGTVNAPAAENIALAQQHLDRMMSCPVFQNDTAFLTQTSCMWAVGAGQAYDQSAFDGVGGYNGTTYSAAMGVQKEIAAGWFLGLAAGYDDSRLTGEGMSIDGNSGWVGATVKYETGPWLLAAALTGSYGGFDNSRSIYIGSVGGVGQGSNDVWGFGARGRVAYTQAWGATYLRPYVDLDLLYNSQSGYTELGAGLLDRQVAGSEQWTGLATPGLELGMRVNLDPDFVLRGYARFGATFSTTDSWTSNTRLVAAPAGVDGLDVVLPLDAVYGRVGAGLDLAALKQGFNLRAEYEGAFSEHSTRNMGTLRFSVNF